MAAPPIISEEDLHAFVDGETDAQTNSLILAHLATSRADAARVENWRRQNDMIRAGFAKIEHEPIPLSLSLKPARNLPSDTPVRLVPRATDAPIIEEVSPPSLHAGDLAKLCAAIGIAFAGGMMAALVTPHVTGPLADLASSRSPSITRAEDSLPLPSQTLQIAGLREASLRETSLVDKGAVPEAGGKSKDGITAKAPPNDFSPAPLLFRDLAALELSVAGFQIGTAERDPALCLFLATKADEPLTICLAKAQAPENFGFRTTEAAPLRSIDWPEKTSHFALAGYLPQRALMELAQRIHARIGASSASQ